MARTVEDLMFEIADKYSVEKVANSNGDRFLFLKMVLDDFVNELASDERCYGDLITNLIEK